MQIESLTVFHDREKKGAMSVREVKRIAEHTEKEEPDNLTHRKIILAGIEREGNVLSQTFALAIQRIDLSLQTKTMA
jgi:hypothetical protein